MRNRACSTASAATPPGDIFDFYGRINGLDFKECLEQLAAEAGITIERGRSNARSQGEERERRSGRQQMLRMYELAAGHFSTALQSPEAAECREYIEKARPERGHRAAFRPGVGRCEWQSLADALRPRGL